MSLYDDIDTDKKSENVAGWASGIKFLTSHMQLKKSSPQVKREGIRKGGGSSLAPVVDFKSKSASGNDGGVGGDTNTSNSLPFILPYSVSVSKRSRGGKMTGAFLSVDPEWQIEGEYDPLFPNDYEKALRDLRERRDKEAEEEEAKRRTGGGDDQEEEHQYDTSGGGSGQGGNNGGGGGQGGVAIAPPASLSNLYDYDDDGPLGGDFKGSGNFNRAPPPNSNIPGGGSGGKSFGLGAGSGAFAAAKIMAKYGYKEGQGLGKKEQGMATALQVEKTSHRIGRIIHEKDLPKEGVVNLLGTPPNLAASYMDEDELEMEQPQEEFVVPGGTSIVKTENVEDPNSAASIEAEAVEQLKNPSKVLLLTNMVGPGEVDDDLEPEVKEECLKYGEVVTVIVFQMPDVDSEDSIRIFVEFVQVDSSVKAFMDLNGRFFGGRQVRASFYNPAQFYNLQLTV